MKKQTLILAVLGILLLAAAFASAYFEKLQLIKEYEETGGEQDNQADDNEEAAEKPGTNGKEPDDDKKE